MIIINELSLIIASSFGQTNLMKKMKTHEDLSQDLSFKCRLYLFK